MKRRELIARAGAVLGGLALAGCADESDSSLAPNGEPAPGPPASTVTAGRQSVSRPTVGTGDRTPPSRSTEPGEESTSEAADREDRGDRFDAVVDAVDDLGMDPTGQKPIDDALEATFDRSVLIEVPAGEYRFTRSHRVEGLRNWGLRGLGDRRSDVRFVVDEGMGALFLNVRSGRNVLVEGVTFDMRQSRPEWINNVFETRDGTVVRDVAYAGFHPSEVYEADGDALSGALLRMRATEPSGVAVVDGMVRRGPTDLGEYPRGHTGISYGGGSAHHGTLRIQNCWIENTGRHGTYCSRAEGSTEIHQTTFKNCNGVAIRIGGEGSFARRCRVVYDDREIVSGTDNRLWDATGMVFEGGGGRNWHGHGGARAEDCVFEFRSLPRGVPSGVIWIDGSHGAATIENCHIINDTGGFAVRAGRPGTSDGSRYRIRDRAPSRPWAVTVSGTAITGTRGREFGGVTLHGRPDSVIRDTSITMSNGLDGVLLDGSDACRLEGVRVDVDEGAGFHLQRSYDTVLDGGSVRSGGVPIRMDFPGVTTGSLLEVLDPPEMTWTDEPAGSVDPGEVSSALRDLRFDGTVDVSMFDGDDSAGVVSFGDQQLSVL